MPEPTPEPEPASTVLEQLDDEQVEDVVQLVEITNNVQKGTRISTNRCNS